MANIEEIAQQQSLLESHRKTLHHLLKQRAVHTSAHEPPAISHGIAEARKNIHHIKVTLRKWGIVIEDQPDDEENNTTEAFAASKTVFSLQEYECRRKEVLSLYETYSSLMQEHVDKSITQKILQIQAHRFTVAVVGEVKAGKSTFINAIIGKPILPTDILQNTSAIIEITHADREFVRVTYAEDPEKSILRVGKVRDVLQKIAAVPEEYRNIPFPRLNDFLIHSKGKYSNSDVDQIINELISEGLIRDANSGQMVRKYLAEYSDLKKVPVEIEVGYPLHSALQGVRIVDTPGIHAVGGLQDITFRYISSANAVVFVHPIRDVEKSHFAEFVEEISDAARKNTFLILTRTGDLRSVGINARLSRAREIFNKFDPNRITYTDSILKMIYTDLEQFNSIEEVDEYYIEQRDHFEHLADQEKEVRAEAELFDQKHSLLNRYRQQNNTTASLQEAILLSSNFPTAEQMIYRFTAIEPLKFINTTLRAMRDSYQSKLTQYIQDIVLFESRISSPELFKQEIALLEQKLDKYQKELPSFLSQLKSEYSSPDSSWRQAITAIEYEAIQRIQASKSQADFRRESQNIVDMLNTTITRSIMEMQDRVYEVLQKHEISLSLDVRPVTISAIDADKIIINSKQKAERVTPIYDTRREFTFNIFEWDELFHKYETRKVREDKTIKWGEFRREMRDKINSQIKRRVKQMITKTNNNIIKYYNDLEEQVFTLISERKNALTELRQEKRKNEEVSEQIRQMKKKANQISNQLNRIHIHNT